MYEGQKYVRPDNFESTHSAVGHSRESGAVCPSCTKGAHVHFKCPPEAKQFTVYCQMKLEICVQAHISLVTARSY